MTIVRTELLACTLATLLCLSSESSAEPQWYKSESHNFLIIYRQGHAHLVSHILNAAESALQQLCRIFEYTPSEKIVINTYDVNDFGAGSATTVPRNCIWLDLSPLEPGYENIPYNERLQWLLNHELVHIVVNDLATDAEALSRSIFSKVTPEQAQPLSVLYSLMTNYSRYTPRWHQEGIAVFLETWLSGGYGRTMGSFDEMYFRALVLEGKKFPSYMQVESSLPHHSFLVETHHYLYGQRFISYLALRYGPEKLLQWYQSAGKDFYITFKKKFRRVYEVDMDVAWDDFIKSEKAFQRENLLTLMSAQATTVRRLADVPLGAVTQPHVDATGGVMYWGQHRPHQLAMIQRFDIKSAQSQQVATLPTPSIHHLASTAFDPTTGMFFYTTNNSQFLRDIWVLDAETGQTRMLFKDCRVGQLTISRSTRELWGVRHQGGVAALVRSPFPYDSLRTHTLFEVGEEIHGLAVSPSGNVLAVVLHKANGEQTIFLSDCERIKNGGGVSKSVVTSLGSPENPSWSPDEKSLFWNAYTNGVSNIYRKDFDNDTIKAVTHSLTGLFKPVFLTKDSLFAFEFSTNGFYPVMLPNSTAEHLPAIKYFGQRIFDSYPGLGDWAPKSSSPPEVAKRPNEMTEYNGLNYIKIMSFLPVITGFGSKKVVGLFTHFSDPIFNHDLILEAGVSPFGERVQPLQFHSRVKYEYQKEFEISWDYNGTDFYDLFNSRKRGMLGNRIRVGNTHHWIYDNPLKVKQQSEITLYSGVQSINDNLVPVSQPDFVVIQTGLTAQNLRRSIGSSDFEYGNKFALTAMLFGSKPKETQIGVQVYGEWDHFATYVHPHNVLHFKLAAGYHRAKGRLTQSRFYFGGFGNRALENVDAKQFREVFRFPGVPIYSYSADRFAKVMLENNFPPVRFGDASLGQHFLSHIDASLFSQAMMTNGRNWFGVDLGAQVNFVFKHWFNLESTLSAGVARAWVHRVPRDEWFVSFKLLKN